MLSNTLKLNFWYLKFIHILRPKVLGYILKNKPKNKCACIHEIIRIIIMKMKIKMKNRSQCNINRPIISHKNHWNQLHFYEKVLKMCHTCSKIPRIPPPTNSMLCQVWKSYVRQWWPGMTKQTCNQHWIREQGVQVSLFLWLIVGLVMDANKVDIKCVSLWWCLYVLSKT